MKNSLTWKVWIYFIEQVVFIPGPPIGPWFPGSPGDPRGPGSPTNPGAPRGPGAPSAPENKDGYQLINNK